MDKTSTEECIQGCSVQPIFCFYKDMRSRMIDSKLSGLTAQLLIRGFGHLSSGQEALAVGSCFDIHKSNYLVCNVEDIRPMLTERLGRVTGYCHGKGGSTHIADFWF